MQSTGLTHAKLVSLTSPCCGGWPAPMNTLQGQQRELSSDGCTDFNAWLGSDLVLIINFNSTHKYHINSHTWHLIYVTCCFLIIGADIKFNHTNWTNHSSGHSHSLFSDYASAQWRLVLHILVTCSPHVNKCWITRAIYGIRCGWSHWPITIQHVRTAPVSRSFGNFKMDLKNICKFWLLIKMHDLLVCNIVKMVPYNGCSQILHISLKTEKSFIAHPWCLLSIVGLKVKR